MKRFFNFWRSFVHFIKIIILFSVLLILLYWIESLTNAHWSWLDYVKPYLNIFLDFGKTISSASIPFFGATFELKYLIAVILLILCAYVADYVIEFINRVEDKCEDIKVSTKKATENTYNKMLDEIHSANEKKLNIYQILVITSLKKKFSHEDLGYNIDEQNVIMNKFLMEKTGIAPKKYENGFLYTFNHFEDIDKILPVFFKLIKSNSPLDYVICVQITGESPQAEIKQLKKLAELRFENKISMCSDTAFRYKYNNFHRYGISQLGVFQQDNDTIEVHEFVEIS